MTHHKIHLMKIPARPLRRLEAPVGPGVQLLVALLILILHGLHVLLDVRAEDALLVEVRIVLHLLTLAGLRAREPSFKKYF